jgi:glycine cleavage system regulatory protein
MMTHPPKIPLVVTVLGRDRPGIVQELARIVADAGGNWEQSNLVRLAGRFAGVVELSAPSESAADALEAALRAVAGGLSIVVDRGEAEISPPSGAVIRVSITGTDRPGIVRDVTRVLVQRGANIVAFSTDTVEAPMAGGLLFRARVEARIAREGLEALKNGLEALQDDLQVDLVDLASVPAE